jgi:hypothetical protein
MDTCSLSLGTIQKLYQITSKTTSHLMATTFGVDFLTAATQLKTLTSCSESSTSGAQSQISRDLILHANVNYQTMSRSQSLALVSMDLTSKWQISL